LTRIVGAAAASAVVVVVVISTKISVLLSAMVELKSAVATAVDVTTTVVMTSPEMIDVSVLLSTIMEPGSVVNPAVTVVVSSRVGDVSETPVVVRTVLVVTGTLVDIAVDKDFSRGRDVGCPGAGLAWTGVRDSHEESCYNSSNRCSSNHVAKD